MAELATIDRTSEVTSYGSACIWGGVKAGERERWLEERRNYLTASDVAAVLGEVKQSSPLQVYLDKVEAKPYAEPTIYEPMFWGSWLERPIFEAAAQAYGWKIRNYGGALLVSRAYPDLACTLDGEIEVEGADATYEGKTTQQFFYKDWDEDEQKAPRKVLLQVQSQLAVTLAPCTKTFCLVGGCHPVLVHVDPHRGVQQMVGELSRNFMKAVREYQQPLALQQDYDRLREMYPRERPGTVVKLPEQARDWAAELLRLGIEKRAVERQIGNLKAKIEQCIGDAEYGAYKNHAGELAYFVWRTQANGSRPLHATKKGPHINRELFALMETARPKELVDDLQASLDHVAAKYVEVRPLPKPKRRQARR